MSDNQGVPIPPDHNADLARDEADRLMRARQWSEAARVLEQLPQGDTGSQLKRRLCNNLAALKQHRPDVYNLLVSLPAQQQYSLTSTAAGKPTVVCRRQDGSLVSLSAGNDPLASAAAAQQQVYAATKAGEPVGLCGIGDGYLLQVLAHQPPKLFMDKQQPVFLIEPEPQIVLQCLMLHDYSGSGGAIEQARFQWFVGADWDARLRETLLGDLFLPSPTLMVGQGLDAHAIQTRLRAVVQRMVERDTELAKQVERIYRGVSAGEFGNRFEPRLGRRPRALLLTTRFSTVLQYSTRDTAAAFERLGWEARVVIEPTPHHRVLRTAIRAALVEFGPDLVFQIDHLRHEHGGLFPENLPFACWIQDHLPHLATREAGESVGPTEFVLTDATATYVDKFGYPARQCVPLPKLTVDPFVGATLVSPLVRDAKRATQVSPLREANPDDVVFVSNASHTADAMTAQALALYAKTPETAELITQCCRRMVAVYDAGGSLPVYGDVCAVLRQTLAELRLNLPSEGFDVLARWLAHPFNDALYRQQALRWAAAAARELGLSLALYGNGWEKHSEFAPFARGPVAYGAALADLTRRSRINLQIVPYLCLHQRLLDGLIAGGFFMVRLHPADRAPAAMLNFLESNLDPSVRTTAAAEMQMHPAARGVFHRLLDDCRPCLCTTGREDVVAMVRDWQESGQLVAGEGPLPRLAEIGFSDAEGLRERVREFVESPSLRHEITSEQRRSVAERLTYDAGMRRVVGRMRELLSEAEANQSRAMAA